MKTMRWEVSQLLMDCLKRNEPDFDDSRLENLSLEDWQDFLEIAKAQRVIPLLWHRLKQKGLNESIPVNNAEVLIQALRMNTMRNMTLYGELKNLLSILNSEGRPLILLKGIFLANSVYENLGLREMNDIDVLARPEDVERIVDILKSMGYSSSEFIFSEAMFRTLRHVPRMIKSEQGVGFEIHWTLTKPDETFVGAKDLWERAVPIDIFGCKAMTLSPEDLLLHICQHTSHQHLFEFGLRPFCDISEIIDKIKPKIDWEIITELTFKSGCHKGVYMALRLAKDLVGADIPSDVLKRIMPIDMTETVLTACRAQVLSDKSFIASMPVPFVKLLESGSLWEKIRIFWNQLFLPKAVIASQYSVPMDSIRIYGYYPLRFIDLFRRHWQTFTKYQQKDEGLKPISERKILIADWLEH
ncbi:MAG: nucleotidyltransferase family protein [Desulfobacterales bacterium]|nr:nucleotidyltransferase family protein [Desulfobacterales bacterium]